jgi:uncharacterized membrane protein YfcA
MLMALGAFLAGVSKTGVTGLGVFSVAIFANVLPARASTGVILPLLVCADVVAVASYRRHAVWARLWRLFPWVAAGIVAGYFALGHTTDRQVRRTIGVILVVLVALQVWRGRAGGSVVPHAWWFTTVTGVAAGFTTMVANASGPVMTLYMLSIGLVKMECLGTGAWFFLIINLFKVPFSHHLGLITTETLRFNAWLVPAVIAGTLTGRWLAQRLSQQRFAAVVLAMTLVAGLRLLW